MEMETHLMIAVRLKFVTGEHVQPTWQTCQEVGKMLNGLIASLQEPARPEP